MATLDDVLLQQKTDHILVAPTQSSSSSGGPSHRPAAASTMSVTPTTVQLELRNNTASATVYAYVIGLDMSDNDSVFLLRSDGVTAYHPANPPADHTPLAVDCAIKMGGTGTTKIVTIPHLSGGRVYFCQDNRLTFLLNRGGRGAALSEPSVCNPSDPNYGLRWDFVEFTFNDMELFANVTYVDFISIPSALKMTRTDGTALPMVKGIPVDGLKNIAKGLQDQQRVDGAGWDKLVMWVNSRSGPEVLRILAPDKASVLIPGLLAGYFDKYIDQAWNKFKKESLTVNTQAKWGEITGGVNSNGDLDFGQAGVVSKPSTADVFSCSSGVFSSDVLHTEELRNIAARIAAALNRSTMHLSSMQPNGVTDIATFYQNATTNHYARVVHAVNRDGRGYTYPYDDVGPSGGLDQAGTVFCSDPAKLTVYIGGGDDNGASNAVESRFSAVKVREMARPGRQLVGGHPSMDQRHNRGNRRLGRRSLAVDVDDSVDEKTLLRAQDRFSADPMAMADLESGAGVTVSAKGESEALYSEAGTPSQPDLTSRLALLLHQAMVHMWAAVCGLGRLVWARVPHRIAGPVGEVGKRVAALPAMAGVRSCVLSLVSSRINSAAATVVAGAMMHPLVVRTVLTVVVLVMTYVAGFEAGSSPALTATVDAMSGFADALGGDDAAITPQ